MEKKIDIIIPVYEAREDLFNCLASIAVQSIVDKIQVTLVNDACPTGSYQDIIDLFKGRMDIQEIILEENRGPGDARQIGIENTNNEIIFFVDADDLLIGPRAIEWIYNEMVIYPDSWVVMGNAVEEMVDGEWMSLPMPNTIWIFAKGYRRSIIEKYNIRFNPGSRACEDVGFNTIVALLASTHEEAVRAIDKLVYLWKYRPNSITRRDDCMYTYADGMDGWIDNVLYAYKTVRDMDDDIEVHAPTLYNFLADWCMGAHIMYANIYNWHPELCPRAWTNLKYFYQEAVLPHVDDMLEEEWQTAIEGATKGTILGEIRRPAPFEDFMHALHDQEDFFDLSEYEEPSES